MSPALTVATVVVVATAGYMWGRWARAREHASPMATGTRDALADIERRLSRLEQHQAAAVRPSIPAAAASRRPAGMPPVPRRAAPSPASPASWGPKAPAAAPSPGPWGPTSSPPAPVPDPWAGTPSGPVAEPEPGDDELARFRSSPRRRSPLEARRHYEALADEVARERRLAEYHARATGTDSAGAQVVHLPIRHGSGPGARVRRYRADQRV